MANKVDRKGFLDYLLYERKWDERRVEQIKSNIKLFADFFDSTPFTKSTFREFVKEMREGGYSYGYINKFVALAKHYAVFINTDSFDTFTYFKQEKKAVDPLTPDEIHRIISVPVTYAKEHDYLSQLWPTLIRFLATTGCRLGEALDLKRSEMRTNPYSVVFVDTKTDEQRIVPIDESLWHAMFNLHNKEVIFSGYRYDKPLTPQAVRYELKRRTRLAKIHKPVYPHIFRHSYITQMIKARVPIVYIARIVGHQDLETTNHYTKLVIDDLVEVIHYHPLLKDKIEFNHVTGRIKKFIDSVVSTSSHTLDVRETPDSLHIVISKK